MTNRNKTFWIIAILVIALFFTFNTLPMIKGVIYSFTNYKGYGSYDVVGWRNYVDLFTDARVGKSYLFTFKYAIAGTILVNVLSLILALGLNSNIKGKSALRGIYFVQIFWVDWWLAISLALYLRIFFRLSERSAIFLFWKTVLLKVKNMPGLRY